MMQILVRRFYQNAQGKTIQPAIYSINDPKLHGLGKYLVDNGIADVVPTDNSVSEPLDDTQDESIGIEITSQARELADTNGVLDEVLEYYDALGYDKIGIADVRDFLSGD